MANFVCNFTTADFNTQNGVAINRDANDSSLCISCGHKIGNHPAPTQGKSLIILRNKYSAPLYYILIFPPTYSMNICILLYVLIFLFYFIIIILIYFLSYLFSSVMSLLIWNVYIYI